MSIFAKMAGIVGESTDDNHSGWMNVLTLHWGIKRNITSVTGACRNRESSHASISELVIVRRMDKATPQLFMESCCGSDGKDFEIHFIKTGQGNGSDVFMSYVLNNAIISGYRIKAHKDDIHRPNEEIRISFTAIETRYISYDANGTKKIPIAVGFNIATNTQM